MLAQQAPGSTEQKNPATRPASAVYPLDAVVDGTGAVWVVDRNAPGVWKYSDGKLDLVIAGSKRFRQPLNAVRCLALGIDGGLLVGDPATREVYSADTATGETRPTVSGIIGIPTDIAVSKDGTVYVADVERRVIWKKSPGEEKPVVFSDCNPRGLFMDADDRLWVVSQNEEQLLRFDSTGAKEIIVAKRFFEFPHQVVVDKDGVAWVSDGYKKGIWRIRDSQPPELVFSGPPLQNPVGLFLADNRIGIVDPHSQSVYRLNDSNQPELWFKIDKP